MRRMSAIALSVLVLTSAVPSLPATESDAGEAAPVEAPRRYRMRDITEPDFRLRFRWLGWLESLTSVALAVFLASNKIDGSIDVNSGNARIRIGRHRDDAPR